MMQLLNNGTLTSSIKSLKRLLHSHKIATDGCSIEAKDYIFYCVYFLLTLLTTGALQED